MLDRRLFVSVAVALVTVCSTAATAAAAEPTQQQAAGRGLAVAGLVVQGIGIGISIGTVVEPAGGFAVVTPPFRFASIPFAPLTIAGFDLWLSDGTAAGHRRALRTGLLEGAAYAGCTAGFGALALAHRSAQEAAADCGDHLCEGDPIPFLIQLPVVLSHAAVALGLLIAGIGIQAGPAVRDNSPGEGVSLWIAPCGSTESAGITIVGSW